MTALSDPPRNAYHRPQSVIDWFHFLLITSFGLGLAPVASGTFGTLGGVVLAVVGQLLLDDGVQPVWMLPVALWGAAAVLLAYGCAQSAFTARTFPRKDPGPFVLDEVVGYLVTVALYTSIQGAPTIGGHVVAFLVFRFFDIAKIQPAKRLEGLPGAPGVMLDDVAAGVYAGLVMTLAHPFLWSLS